MTEVFAADISRSASVNMTTRVQAGENVDTASFFITKHSWRGKYNRIFCIGSHGIRTLNPNTLETTNSWPYSEVISVMPSAKAVNEFMLVTKKGKKQDTMRFSTDHCIDLLTEALRFRSAFSDPPKELKRFNASKHHWSDSTVPIVLEVDFMCLWQKDATTSR